MYPMTNFVHFDNAIETLNDSLRNASFEGIPNANSTMIESRQQSQNHGSNSTSMTNSNNLFRNLNYQSQENPVEYSSHSVGHVSHIPRTPPTPGTYTLPTIMKSIGTEKKEEDLFGMIKLGDNDVCYTSGTLEWVGRKRSFPLNSGFKILSQSYREMHEPTVKKVKQIHKTSLYKTNDVDNIRECDCADVLPTVNAIVDHLNVLHEAVDLVDLRLHTLEGVITKNN